MKFSAVRSLTAQGVIGMSMCLGGYAALVLPMREKLGAARAELAQAESRAAEAGAVESSMASVMDHMARAERQAAAITAAGDMARSQEALYAAVSTRAASLGVRIDEFSPVERGRSGAPGMERSSAAPGDVVLRCRFAATGSFGQLAQLLRVLSRESGFAAVRSVRLSPAPDAGAVELVHAEVETEHYAVDPTPVAAATISAPGAGGGQP
jgi:hypothetical protein